MSLREAIVNATRQTLSTYLAPELVEQLTEEIVHRMAPEVEAALTHLAGFDLGRPATPARVRGATPHAAAGKKARSKAAKETVASLAEDATTPHPSHVAALQSNGGGASSTEVPPSH